MRFREILRLYEESNEGEEDKDEEDIESTDEQDSDDKEESEDNEKLSDPEDDVDSEEGDSEEGDSEESDSEELEDPDTSEDEEDEDNLEKVNELIVNKFIKDYNKRIDYYTKQIKKVGMQVTLKKFIEALVEANTENPALKMLLSLDTDAVMMEIEEQLKSKLADKIAGDTE